MARLALDPRIEAIRKSRREHAAGREDFRREFPEHFKERYNPDTGRTDWKVNVENWRDGKRTKEGLKMQEMMTPQVRAEAVRSAERPRPATVPMRGEGGVTNYVPPHLVRAAYKQNGWREVNSSAPVYPLERGPDGMLFRGVDGEWKPTGRWCLTKPFLQNALPEGGHADGTITHGVQRAPDGTPWRCADGAWERA